MGSQNDGKFERTYSKVVGITGGMGFSGGGPLPRGLLLAEQSISVTFKDIHGNEVTLGGSGAPFKPTLLEGLQNKAAVVW